MIRNRVEHRTEEPNSVFSNMPFTPAHPAILLPLKIFRNLKLSWTALIIGSIVPDFEYFIWLSSCASVSHTISGILTFNLPLTIILSYIYHRIIYPVLWPRLNFFKETINFEHRDDFFEWLKKNWLMFTVSALIGILSHLIWDSFCHANGYMVHQIPFLLETATVGAYEIRRCYLLWYGSTVAGCIAMAIVYLNFKKVLSKENWKTFFAGGAFWGKILFLAILIASIRIAIGLSWNWTRHLVIISLGSFFYATIIVCWLEIAKREELLRREAIPTVKNKGKY